MSRPPVDHARKSSISTADSKEPHAVSLKVLRLTRPSLSTQHPLPSPSTTLSSTFAQSIPRAAGLAYPSAPSDPFALSPLVTLPPEFGNAYVGETFSCTLCANNELRDDGEGPIPRIHGVKIETEMKTPSQTVPVAVSIATYPTQPGTSQPERSERGGTESTPLDDSLRSLSMGDTNKPEDVELAPGQTLQGILTHHLREDGPHVLSVTISYTISTPTSGRHRSFRKLYQFVATPALVVRTKIAPLGGERKGAGIKASGARTSEDVERKRRKGDGWALEAQLENVGEEGVVLESVQFVTDEWCRAFSIEELWARPREGEEAQGVVETTKKHVLNRGGVHQACFFVERVEGKEQEGKTYMGVLNIKWRGPMGNLGELSTGWLGLRR